ncbi:MAG TPA: hypothetical protein ENJ08_05725 [Gammaproteobacteria bacterium]|nr:hypothetical protein [Gammaproteobacteria bacterium]
MKHVLFLMLLLQSIAGSAYAVAGDLSERLAGFAQINESAGDFVETWFANYLNEPLVSRGRLTYKKPGQLGKFIISPERIEQHIAGSRLSIKRHGEIRYIQLSEKPELAAGVIALQAVLDGDEEKLHIFFKLQYKESQSGWKLSLVPKDKRLAKSIEQVVLQGQKYDIQQVRVLFLNGNKLLTEITHGN